MKRSALLPLTAAAGAVTARQLYDAAFAREDPALVRTVKQLRPGHGHSRRYFQLRDAAAGAARRAPQITLRDISPRGNEIVGHLYPAGPVPARTVAFIVHGFRSSGPEAAGPFLSFYHRRGIDVFACDHEAAGDSAGRRFTYGCEEARCCLQWLRRLIARYGPEVRILLHGFSMGAATVLLISDRCPPQVKFLVSDSSYTSGPEILRFKTAGHPGVYPVLAASARVLDGLDLRETDVRPHLLKTNRPVLFVHGTADPTVPCRMGRELYALCPADKDLLLVSGGRHVESIFRVRAAYEAKLDAFLGRYGG